MSTMTVLRMIFALIMSAALAWAIARHDEQEEDAAIQPKKARYTPFLPVTLLPSVLVVCIPVLWYVLGWRGMMENMIAICFTILLQLSLYTALLMALLPLLRRRLRPSACAILWMVPNYLYLCVNSAFRAERPWKILLLPGKWFVVLGVVWIGGFLAVMLWGIVSHLRFRHAVLAASRPETEPEVLALLEQERDHAGQRKLRYRLVRSPAVKTPLTIGMFSRSTRIVLPERTYTQEELRLILRHEMVHIGRGDSTTKFYLLFCTALGWWNPLMWLARRRSADDLELSCDETVLRSMDTDCRRPYAELLLRTAGDQRGFTTCLSASAGALRYRLRQVMEPGKRTSGLVVSAVAFVLLLTTMGSVTIGYLPEQGETLLLDGTAAETFSVEEIYTWDDGRNGTKYYVTDEAALWQYLSESKFYRITPLLYSFDMESMGRSMTIRCQGTERTWMLDLYEDYVQCAPLAQLGRAQCFYSKGILKGLLQSGILKVDENFT